MLEIKRQQKKSTKDDIVARCGMTDGSIINFNDNGLTIAKSTVEDGGGPTVVDNRPRRSARPTTTIMQRFNLSTVELTIVWQCLIEVELTA